MFERRNFLTWSLASIGGSAAGIVIMNLGQLAGVTQGAAALVLILPAILTAAFQWVFCLRSLLPAFPWILVSILGRFSFGVLWFWLWFFFDRPTTPYGPAIIDFEWYAMWTISAAVAGAIFGLCQWFLLRRVFDGAEWWILATAVGAATAWCYKLVVIQFELSETLQYLDLVANSHAIPAVVQGLLFVGVLRLKQSRQEVGQPANASQG